MIHATSAPVKKAHPDPHRTCVTRINGNAVTRPVITMPAARNRCPITSGHLRPIASAQTPVGISASANVADTTVPSKTIWEADKCASTTK